MPQECRRYHRVYICRDVEAEALDWFEDGRTRLSQCCHQHQWRQSPEVCSCARHGLVESSVSMALAGVVARMGHRHPAAGHPPPVEPLIEGLVDGILNGLEEREWHGSEHLRCQ